MRCQVLLPRGVENIFRDCMFAVGEQGPAVMPFVVKSMRFVAIIDRHDKTAPQGPSDILYPPACFQAHFGLLAIL